MPAKTKQKRIASRTGARTGKRAKGYKPSRRGTKAAAAVDAILADSIYNVRFSEKPGTEVFCALEHANADEFEKMYNDLWKAWAKLRYLTTGEKRIDVSSFGVTKASVLHYVLADFKQLLPSDFKFNIERDQTGQYYFMVYKECQWDQCWHYLVIGPAVNKLYKENRRLHDLFLSFLRELNNAGVNLWCEESMGWDLDCMDDRVVQGEDEWDPEELEAYQNCIIKYADGPPARYSRLITRAKRIKPVDLMKRAARYKAGHPIANLIHQGAAELVDGHSMYDFMYMPGSEDEEGMAYLELDCMTNIIWEEGDGLYNDHSETLDSMANEGLQEPVLSFRIDADTRKIDFAQLNKKAHWPYQLSKWFGRAIDLIEKYTHERKNRAAIKNI